MIRRFYEKYFKGDVIKLAKLRINKLNQIEILDEMVKKHPNEEFIKLQNLVFMLCDITAPSLELLKELKEN